MKKIYKLLKFLALMITIITTIYILLLINNNLKSYSVYYAKNMPNTRKEIEIMVLIDNLYWVENPELEGYKYDFDGNYIIYQKNKRDLDNYRYFSTGNDYHYVSSKNISYRFNNQLDIKYAFDVNEDIEEINIKTIDEEAIKQEIYEMVKPIIDVQPEPKINLQWIFNLVYIDYR